MIFFFFLCCIVVLRVHCERQQTRVHCDPPKALLETITGALRGELISCSVYVLMIKLVVQGVHLLHLYAGC